MEKGMNILLAVDLSDATDKVVEAARGVADLTGATIHVFHVVEAGPDYFSGINGIELTQDRIATDFPLEHSRVKTIVDKLVDDGFDASMCLRCGQAVKLALQEADRLEAGLIVVGSHGHGAVFSVLIGSFSTGIIRKSVIPVLVVPIRES
jgi:nucleotide-binding universal stress UspA family protein